MASNNPLTNLAFVSMRQLREMARKLGISRYSAQTREGLADAIAGKAGSKGEEPFMLEKAVETAEEAASANLMAMEAEMAPAPRSTAETRVVFLPRDPQWAYVFWDITPADRDAALAAGATQLCLRVADVTGLSGGSSHPHTLQEVVVDSHATEWYLPVPLSDRDYRVELGYRKGGAGGWMSLAFSSVARVPALHPSEQILDQFVPFSLDSPPSSPLLQPAHRSGGKPPIPACMSACTKPPRPVGGAWDGVRKPFTNWPTTALTAPACMPRVWGCGPRAAVAPGSAGWHRGSAPSGWWPTPS